MTILTAKRNLTPLIRYGINKPRLVDEINVLKYKVDPLIWQAIDAVRKIGNIGAHMKKDINLIINVEPLEASALIGLIEMLLKDWYVHKHERRKQLQEIVSISEAKNGIEKTVEVSKM